MPHLHVSDNTAGLLQLISISKRAFQISPRKEVDWLQQIISIAHDDLKLCQNSVTSGKKMIPGQDMKLKLLLSHQRRGSASFQLFLQDYREITNIHIGRERNTI